MGIFKVLGKGEKMKIAKRICIILLIIAFLLTAVFLAGRYGWKLLGFRACQGAGIESIEVDPDEVRIKGFYPGSFPEGFCGYYAEERDGKLYVGFRFSAIFGIFETGDFDAVIPHEQEINEIILKTKIEETRIWTAEQGLFPSSERNGIYVKLERRDVQSISVDYSDRSKGFENAEGSDLASGEWFFLGEDIAGLSMKENRAVPFTIRASAANGKALAEETFVYDIAREKLYITISEHGVTCSLSDAPETSLASDVPAVVPLPILDEIDQSVFVGTAGSSLQAVQAAVKLLDWGVNTGLDPSEIHDSAIAWIDEKNGEEQKLFLEKLASVQAACESLRGDNAQELLEEAGCGDTEIFWGSESEVSIEALMNAAGLSDADE